MAHVKIRGTLLCNESKVRAQEAGAAPGGDPAADRRGRRRAAHVGRPRADHDLCDRLAGGRRAAHRLRALPRRAGALPRLLRPLAAQPSARRTSSAGEIEDPVRASAGSRRLYAWYECVEADLALFSATRQSIPANAEALGEMTADSRLADASARLAAPQERAVRRSATRSTSRPGGRSSGGRASRARRRSTRWCVCL